MRTKRPFHVVAKSIARDLFTDGRGKRAARLAMKHKDGAGEREGSGWCEKAAANRIEEHLTRRLSHD